jgi:hypothetical protein
MTLTVNYVLLGTGREAQQQVQANHPQPAPNTKVHRIMARPDSIMDDNGKASRRRGERGSVFQRLSCRLVDNLFLVRGRAARSIGRKRYDLLGQATTGAA